MRTFSIAAAIVATALLGTAPAHAAAATVKINEPCPAGYNEHASATVEGNTVRFCSIP